MYIEQQDMLLFLDLEVKLQLCVLKGAIIFHIFLKETRTAVSFQVTAPMYKVRQ